MSLLRRISNLFFRSRLDREIDAELRSHIEMRIEDNLVAGMPREEARRDAMMRFGNLTSTRERVAGADATLTLDSIWCDMRYACRQLLKNRGFSCTAIVVLAMGMSASVAIFSFVDAVLIKPLPYQNPARLAELFESTPLGPRFHLSYLDYLDWKRQNKVFTSLEAYDGATVALRTEGGTQRVEAAVVSAGFFHTLGVTAVIGRDFISGEDSPSAPRTIILSYAAWQSRFGQREDVLGQVVTLDDTSGVIVGVLPKDFQFAPTRGAEFWTTLHESSIPNSRGNHGLSAIARLKDGVTWEVASLEMSSIARQLAQQYPDSNEGRGATVLPLTEVIVGNQRPILLLLLCGAVLLVVIACVNVSGLLLVRSENRRHEIAVRGALGASRLRLVRQFILEGSVLAAAGSLLGICAACGAIHLLTRLVPPNMLRDMPYLKVPGLGGAHSIGFAAVVTMVMATLFSLTPVFRLSLKDLRTGLTEGGRSSVSKVWRHLGANLVAVELCTATVLLVGAGLLGKSSYRLLHTDIGVQPNHLATMRMAAPTSRYAKDEQVIALAHRVMDETRRLPGVQSVAIAHQIPVSNVAGGNTTFEIIGKPKHESGNESSSRNVSGDYLRTVQARLVRGRYFSDKEDITKPRVAIINQSFARKYFPSEDPIGGRIRYDASMPPIEIIGIVDDIKEGPLDQDVQPVLYTPFSQEPDSVFFIVARTAQKPQELLKSLEGTVHRLDPDIMTFEAETMEDRISQTQATYLHRSSAWLIGGFAAIALFLSVVGIYGVIAYSVSQRTREIGVRLAMGAQRSTIYRLILIEAGRLTGIGLGAGMLCSIAVASLMRKLLYGTQPWDMETFGAAVVVLSISALFASYIPARRAVLVDPVEALRTE